MLSLLPRCLYFFGRVHVSFQFSVWYSWSHHVSEKSLKQTSSNRTDQLEEIRRLRKVLSEKLVYPTNCPSNSCGM